MTQPKKRTEPQDRARALAALDTAIANESDVVDVRVDSVELTLTSLRKSFFPKAPGGAQTKGDLLRYYLSVAPEILTHLRERPVVLTRYPNGAGTKGFYVQRAPEKREPWVTTCMTCVKPPKEVEYLTIDSTAMLLWVANLSAIEMHPWYSRCSATTRPDYLVIDLDPTVGTSFSLVREAALHVKEALDAWSLPGIIKTSGSTGVHLFVPIKRGPVQQDVHDVARDVAVAIEARHPRLFTTEYRVARRPRRRVLLDHNQNALGHHLAGAYSARPKPNAPVSTPLEWEELEEDIEPGDFTIATVPHRLARLPDPWRDHVVKPLRISLEQWRREMLRSTR